MVRIFYGAVWDGFFSSRSYRLISFLTGGPVRSKVWSFFPEIFLSEFDPDFDFFLPELGLPWNISRWNLFRCIRRRDIFVIWRNLFILGLLFLAIKITPYRVYIELDRTPYHARQGIELCI